MFMNDTPTRFEDEFPEEAAILMELCQQRLEDKKQGKPIKPIHFDAPIISGTTVGRNEPCPCGSGKKYKKCCQ